MRDALLDFGAITAATKDTVAYSANVLDMGATRKTGNLDNINVVIEAGADFASADTVAVQLYDSADGSTFALIQQSAAVTLKQGETFAMPVPKTHRRYLKAAVLPKSTGTFTSTSITACIQPGV